LHDAPQSDPINFEQLARAGSAGSHQARTARKHVQLARELAGFVHCDADLRILGRADDFDLSFEHNEETPLSVHLMEADLATLNPAAGDPGSQPGNLWRTQLREDQLSGIRTRFSHTASASDDDFVHVAPHPVLTRLERLHNRMLSRVKMFG